MRQQILIKRRPLCGRQQAQVDKQDASKDWGQMNHKKRNGRFAEDTRARLYQALQCDRYTIFVLFLNHPLSYNALPRNSFAQLPTFAVFREAIFFLIKYITHDQEHVRTQDMQDSLLAMTVCVLFGFKESRGFLVFIRRMKNAPNLRQIAQKLERTIRCSLHANLTF